MKLILTCLLTVYAISAQAISLGDIIRGIDVIRGGGHGQQQPLPPTYRPPGPPGYPGHGGHDGHGHGPGYYPPPGPGYPPPPPQQNISCRAEDKGWEEHFGGHGSCGECVRYHGRCVETCSANTVDCQVDGQDQYGRNVTFYGRAGDQYQSEELAMYNCRYNYAYNCRVVQCNQHQDVVSRRDCR